MQRTVPAVAPFQGQRASEGSVATIRPEGTRRGLRLPPIGYPGKVPVTTTGSGREEIVQRPQVCVHSGCSPSFFQTAFLVSGCGGEDTRVKKKYIPHRWGHMSQELEGPLEAKRSIDAGDREAFLEEVTSQPGSVPSRASIQMEGRGGIPGMKMA